MKFNSIFSTVLAILSLVFGAYQYLDSQKEKEPVYLSPKGFLIYSERPDIKSSKYKMIEVTEEGDHVLSKNVFVQEVAFWNKGEIPIEKKEGDILNEMYFDFPDGYKIIDAFISESSRFDIVRPKIETKDNKIYIDFNILEKNDGFKINVIFSGEKYAKASLNGAIKGVARFYSKDDLVIENILSAIFDIVFFAISILLFSAACYWGSIYASNFLKKRYPHDDVKIKKRIETSLVSVMILLAALVALSLAALRVAQVAEDKASNSIPIMEQIPSENN